MAERKKKNPAETKKPKEKKVFTYADVLKGSSTEFKNHALKVWKEKGIKLTDEFPKHLTRI